MATPARRCCILCAVSNARQAARHLSARNECFAAIELGFMLLVLHKDDIHRCKGSVVCSIVYQVLIGLTRDCRVQEDLFCNSLRFDIARSIWLWFCRYTCDGMTRHRTHRPWHNLTTRRRHRFIFCRQQCYTRNTILSASGKGLLSDSATIPLRAAP